MDRAGLSEAMLAELGTTFVGELRRAGPALVGDYTVYRAYFCCDGCHVGAAPLDARLGLGRVVLDDQD